MAKSGNYYNVDDFNTYKRKQGKLLPPKANVLAAACHVQALFDAKKFVGGFMGGLSMLCIGYKREMPDLHIAYDDKDFERLKIKLESDQRIRLPTGVNPLLPFKILVWTGPDYRDQGCTVNASIELDLVPSGSYGTPAGGNLTKNLILLGLTISNGQQMTFKSLNIHYLMATMLSYCKAHDLLWDPRKDILYLCKNTSAEVYRIRNQLSTREVRELFLGTLFFTRLHVEDQRLCYRVLLDTEPPPTMAITPPPPQTRTTVQSHQRGLEQNCDARTPRSRYHNVSGPRSSSSGTPDHQAPKVARPQSMDHLQDPRRFSQIQGVQCVNYGKPQPVSAATAARKARKSMPNLMAANDTAPSLVASAQNVRNIPVQQRHHEMNHVNELPAPSLPTSLQQTHASSQLEYGGGFQPAHMRAGSNTDNINQRFPLGQRTSTAHTNSTGSDSTGTSARGIQSQKGSLHVVSPEEVEAPRQQYFQDESVPPRGKLHVVNPEGPNGIVEKPQNATLTRPQHQRQQSAPHPQIQPPFVFELDATALSKATFIAELPANPIMPPNAERRTTQDYGAPNASAAIKPDHPRRTSAPVETASLPASLVAGGSGTRAHHQSHEPMLGFSTPQTNAYRYSSYASPQPAGPEHMNASLEESMASSYKAYRPFAAANELNRNDSVSSVYGSLHRRDTSNDSTASHDSTKLAKEYQELLNFEDGYGST